MIFPIAEIPFELPTS